MPINETKVRGIKICIKEYCPKFIAYMNIAKKDTITKNFTQISQSNLR